MRITFINYNGSITTVKYQFFTSNNLFGEDRGSERGSERVKVIEVCEWVTKSLARKLYEETLLFMISPICACGVWWQVVSLVCVCLGKSNLLNKFIFSDSALDFRWLCRLFSTEEVEKWNAEIRFLSSHKKQNIRHPNEQSSSFHARKYPVTWHYKLNQLYDLTFVVFYLRGSWKHKFKTPLSNQFAYSCSDPFIGYLLETNGGK